MKFFVAAFLVIGILLDHCQAAAYTEDNYRALSRKCSKILGTSSELLKQVEGKEDFTSDDREVHCVVRCVGILTGFYDDETGTNWELVAQQMEGKEGFEEHRQATTECVQALPEEEVQADLCRKAYLSVRCAMESAKQHLKDKN